MTHLNIQQGSNVEIVTAQIIKKLYDAALSVPEPQSGEEDAAYMSGNLQVNKAYRSQVEYLTNRFNDLSINVTIGYYISFEDSAVLNALLANNIGDGIGVTEAEAANAIFTNSTFRTNTNIISFNTFGLFTKANNNPPGALFQNCTSLTSIDMSNITKISTEEFSNTALTSVTMPNLTSFTGNSHFRGCTSLTSVDFTGSSITYIPSQCFLECTSLVSAIFPSTVTTIKDNAFNHCGITSIPDLSNIVSLENNGFDRHPDWEFVVNLANVTDLGQVAIGRTGGKCRVKQIYIPKVTHTYNNGFYTNYVYYRGAFCGLNSDLIYLRDIQVLHPGDFGNTACTNLVINNITPPVWNNNGDRQDSEIDNNAWRRTLVFVNSNITRIYVPDSAVTTYQNDTYWSTLADKIQPLSQLTKVATEADLQANQIALIEAYM